MATTKGGAPDARSLYKGGEGTSYTGLLKTLNKGSAVMWSKSLCANCNGARSQPFDLAYEKLSDYLWNHQDTLFESEAIDLSRVFGSNWQEEARNAARYLGKQLGCSLVHDRLAAPAGLIEFLDGGPSGHDLSFHLFRERRYRDLHEVGKRHGTDLRGYWLDGLLAYTTRDGTKLTGAVYTYNVGFVALRASWLTDSTWQSFFETRITPLPLVGDPLPDELVSSMEDSHRTRTPEEGGVA